VKSIPRKTISELFGLRRSRGDIVSKTLNTLASVRLRLKSSSLRGISSADDCARELFENFSEILPSSGWAQVRYQQPKMAKNLPYCWHHSQKHETQNQKKFFHSRLADSTSLLRVWTAL